MHALLERHWPKQHESKSLKINVGVLKSLGKVLEFHFQEQVGTLNSWVTFCWWANAQTSCVRRRDRRRQAFKKTKSSSKWWGRYSGGSVHSADVWSSHPRVFIVGEWVVWDGALLWITWTQCPVQRHPWRPVSHTCYPLCTCRVGFRFYTELLTSRLTNYVFLERRRSNVC